VSRLLFNRIRSRSPDHYAKGTRSPCQLPSIGLSPLVGVWFQVQCPPLTGVLPTVRSRYWFAIGRQIVLSLTGWTPWIQTHFHVLSRTQVPARSFSLSPTGLSPSMVRFPVGSARYSGSKCRSYNPAKTYLRGLG
jgi:hypothetical protein